MILKTTVIGSASVPEWFETLRQARYRGEISQEIFDDARIAAALAAIKEQEEAGISIISDGELFRRENNVCGPPNAMIGSFASKIPGFAAAPRMKKGITPVAPDAELPAPVIIGELQPLPLGLLDELTFLRQHTTSKVKIAMTGPHMFSRIAWDEYYGSAEKVALAMAEVVRAEFARLDDAGCDVIQLDEPVLWFLPGDREWGVKEVNRCFSSVKKAIRAIHVCQGNYQPDPLAHCGIRIFPSEFASILPLLEAITVDVVLMSLAGIGETDWSPLKNFPQDKILGAGVIDVQSHTVETPRVVADRLKQIAQYVPVERLWVNPDCGLNHLPRALAFAKMKAMAEGALLAARELGVG